MQPHPYADLFPLMDRKALQELVASIRDDGLEQPIVTFEGKILDGRNRALACANAQVKPIYEKYTGSDPLGYVMRSNLTRRHLTPAQRGMVAAKMANLSRGSNRFVEKIEGPEKPSITNKEAATLLNVGVETVKKARKLVRTGDEELMGAVERGELPLTTALKRAAPEVVAPIEEVQSGKLLRLWDRTGAAGRKLFLIGIGAD